MSSLGVEALGRPRSSMMQASRAPVFLLCLPHNSVVLTEFLLEDEGDGWWHCPSPLRCKVLDGPASRAGETGRFWLVETDPVIEWHGDPQYPGGPIIRSCTRSSRLPTLS
jgi:hypothetical protein